MKKLTRSTLNTIVFIVIIVALFFTLLLNLNSKQTSVNQDLLLTLNTIVDSYFEEVAELNSKDSQSIQNDHYYRRESAEIIEANKNNTKVLVEIDAYGFYNKKLDTTNNYLNFPEYENTTYTGIGSVPSHRISLLPFWEFTFEKKNESWIITEVEEVSKEVRQSRKANKIQMDTNQETGKDSDVSNPLLPPAGSDPQQGWDFELNI